MNQCAIRSKAMSEFSGLNKSGHDFAETGKRIESRNEKPVIVQTLKCLECGHISEAWNYIEG